MVFVVRQVVAQAGKIALEAGNSLQGVVKLLDAKRSNQKLLFSPIMKRVLERAEGRLKNAQRMGCEWIEMDGNGGKSVENSGIFMRIRWKTMEINGISMELNGRRKLDRIKAAQKELKERETSLALARGPDKDT